MKVQDNEAYFKETTLVQIVILFSISKWQIGLASNCNKILTVKQDIKDLVFKC